MVQVFCGAQFYRGAWNQLKIGASNMDTLVALGSTTAFGYSAWALLAGVGGHVYFMEAAAIITLISLGHWMEARVSDKASGALKSLLTLAPQTARTNSEFRSRNSEAGNFDLRTASFSQFRDPHIRNPQLKQKLLLPNPKSATMSRCDLAIVRRLTASRLKANPRWMKRCSPGNPCWWTNVRSDRLPAR